MPGRFRSRVLGVAAVLVAAGFLAGCSLWEDEDRLPGERIHIRRDPKLAVPLEATVAPLPAVNRNSEWTQTNGTATHNLGNLAGPTGPSEAWTADAGAGTSGDSAITSAPVVAGGAVFTLDAQSQVTAFDAGSGSVRWRTNLAPEGEDGNEGFGGGLAYDGGRLYATTGFGEVLALDPASGEIAWRQSFGAPFRAAPAALQGLVVAVTRDNRALGLAGDTGKLVWRVQGASSEAGLLGGASPAMAGALVAVPFTSGELVGVNGRNGRRVWSAILSGGRKGFARAAITDVSGDPVIVGPLVVAANQSGRMVAIDGRNGQRAWTRNIGSDAPIWAAGDTIFVIGDDAMLMRISARDGSTLWASQLPAYDDPEDREGPIAYSGPVLVAGRLLLTDSEGNLLSYDAETGVGQQIGRISGGSLTGPVVANGMVYVLSEDGRLYAFR